MDSVDDDLVCSYVAPLFPPPSLWESRADDGVSWRRVRCGVVYDIYEHEGVLYLYVKVIERAHTPKNMWQKIKLSSNYTKALEQVSFTWSVVKTRIMLTATVILVLD